MLQQMKQFEQWKLRQIALKELQKKKYGWFINNDSKEIDYYVELKYYQDKLKEPNIDLNQQELNIVNQINKNLNEKQYDNFKKINEIRDNGETTFIKIGPQDIISDTILLYAFSRIKDCKLVTYWSYLNDPFYLVERNITFNENAIKFFKSNKIDDSREYGTFIILKGSWGFLLNNQSINHIYNNDELKQSLQNILKEPLFHEIFRKFAFYMLKEDEKEKDDEIKERKISNTLDDPAIEDYYIQFTNQMFAHQRQEVGWMYNYEKNPYVEYPSDLNFIPLLDTGKYFNMYDPSNLCTKKGLQSTQYYMPGGVLGSQIGSGKTISIIGLTSIGYQINDPVQQEILQQNLFQNEELKKIFNNKLIKNEDIDLQQQNAQLYGEQIREHLKIQQLKKSLEKNLDYVYLPSLIIVTQNILYQWAEEYQKFAPFLRVLVIENHEDFLNKINLETKSGINLNKNNQNQIYNVIKDYDILITHRNALVVLFNNYQFKSNLFNIDFRRVIFDEFHEITNIHQKIIQKGQEPKKNDQLQENIEQFYEVCQKIKRQMTWGVTGTLDNVNYRDDTTSMGKLLNLHEAFYNVNFYDSLKDQFIEKCIRSNPRCIELPELKRDVKYLKFGQIQKLLYRGKLENRQGEQYAREICSHFTNQYKFLEDMQDQFENAIEVIQQQLQQEINKILDCLQLGKNVQLMKNRLENLTGENNFYQEVIDVLRKQLAIMNCELQNNKKYDLYFKIETLGKNSDLGIGIFKRGSKNLIEFLQDISQKELVFMPQDCVSVLKFFKEEYQQRKLSYLRCAFLSEQEFNQNYIYEYQFLIKKLDGKQFMSIGLCDYYTLLQQDLVKDPSEFKKIEQRQKQNIPENREEFMNQGAYMIRADGLEYNHHDINQNLYYTQFSFSEGDTIQIEVNSFNKTIKYTNKNTNQTYIQQYKEIEKQEFKVDNPYNLNDTKQDEEVGTQKDEEQKYQKYEQEDMLRLGVYLYSFNDEIQLVSTKKLINLQNYNITNLEATGHGFYMLNCNGVLFSDHDEDNNMLQNINGFKLNQNDKLKLTIDLLDNQITYTNLNSKKFIVQDFKEDMIFQYAPAIILSQGDKVQCVEQIQLFECPLCFEDLPKKQLVITNCLHQICVNCYDALIRSKYPHCPYCKSQLMDAQIIVHPKLEIQHESKVQLLVDMIQRVNKEDKIIIYTQFNDLTKRIANIFDQINLEYIVLKGEPTDININLKQFKKNPEIKVLIMSIEQAASGINITEANHVIFVHPIFGLLREKAEVVYQQCIGRAYRIGQNKQVHTTILVTKDSIEEEAMLPFINSTLKFKQNI